MAYDPRRLPIDMTPDGQFRGPPRTPISSTIITAAVIVAVVAGGLAIAGFLLWLWLSLIPVVVVAVLVAIGTIRFKLWRARRQAEQAQSFRRDGQGVWRP